MTEQPPGELRRLTDDEREVVEENMGLVYDIAWNRKNKRLPVEDRVQAGTLGLMRAVQKYEPSTGALSTYATWWIKSFIQQAEMKHDLIHVPSRIRYNHADETEQANAKRFHEYRDQAFAISGGVCDEQIVGRESPEVPVDDADEIEWLMSLLDRLPEKHRKTLLSIHAGETPKAIGRREGVSRSAVVHRERTAMRSLAAICQRGSEARA